MNVICQQCNAEFNIPDQKIPKDKDSSVKCPKCSEKIVVPAERKGTVQTVEKKNNPIGLLFQDRQKALICTDDRMLLKKLYSTIKQNGFQVEIAKDSKSALNRLEYYIYPLMVIDEAVEIDQGFKKIIEKMNTIDMSVRRRICIVRIRKNVDTNNNMAALHASVNSIIQKDDISHFDSFLMSCLAEYRNLYTVYNESLKLAGKA